MAKINPFADLFMEQQKARGGRFSLADAMFRPGWRFFRAYVLKLGLLDGYPGFYIAWADRLRRAACATAGSTRRKG